MESAGVDGVSDGAVELGAAATVPEERGRGVGLALTAAGVAAAQDAGYAVCFSDWRTANPLSSTCWQARGFAPYLFRMVRRRCVVPQGDGGGRLTASCSAPIRLYPRSSREALGGSAPAGRTLWRLAGARNNRRSPRSWVAPAFGPTFACSS